MTRQPTTQEEDIQSLLVRVKYGEESILDACTDILTLLDTARMNGFDNGLSYALVHSVPIPPSQEQPDEED